MNDLIADWMTPYLPIIGAVVRGGIQLSSGVGFTWAATVSGDQTTLIVTAVAAALSLGWSIWQKIAAAKAAREAEVAAAKATAAATMAAGRPVPLTVLVTPEGHENKAVRIAPAEIAAAPAVPVDVTPSPAPKAA